MDGERFGDDVGDGDVGVGCELAGGGGFVGSEQEVDDRRPDRATARPWSSTALGDPFFCSPLMIAVALNRYDSTQAYGWGGSSCVLDETAVGYAMTGPSGADVYLGFLARVDGDWTVLQLLPDGDFKGCGEGLSPDVEAVCRARPGTASYPSGG